MTPFTVGDTAPALTGTLTSNGAPVILTGASLVARIHRPGIGATIVRGASIVSATAGTWSFTWQTGDLDTAGTWEVFVVVTYSSGAIETFGPDSFQVQES